MKIEDLIAIDSHVHIEMDSPGNETAEAARKYFGVGNAPRLPDRWLADFEKIAIRDDYDGAD